MTNALSTLGRQFDKAIIPVLRANSIGKMLSPVNRELSGQGLGVLSVETFKYVARGEPVTNYDIQQDIPDAVDVQGSITRIPVQQEDAIIKRRDWDAYNLKGVKVQNDLAEDMAAAIALHQSKIIVDGWAPKGSSYEIKGMFQVAANDFSGSDSGTYGNMLKNVAGAISKLKTAKIYSAGYNLTLPSFNYAELDASVSTAGISEADQVLKVLNRAAPNGQTPGQIIESVDLSAGYGMVSPVATPENIRFMDIVETQIPVNQLWYKDGNIDSGDIMVRQVGALVPRFKHLTVSATDPCICTISGMGSS
jgi:hypothetical protein